jgi:23S rRNA (cytosine1962-C5)-methyltransferase
MTTPIDYIDKPNNLIETQRLFHGRGHAYPGLEHVNIDWIFPAIIITLYAEVERDWLEHLCSELTVLFKYNIVVDRKHPLNR